MTVLVVIEAVALALLVLLVAGLLRSHAEILRALHDLGLGHDEPASTSRAVPSPVAVTTPAAAGAAADVGGSIPGGDGVVVVGVVGAERPTLLAFLSSGCLTCHSFWETFSRPELQLPGGARLAVVTMGSEAESEAAVARLAPRGVTVLMSSEAWEAYSVPGSPYFVYVDGGRVVGEGTAQDWAQVVELMSRAANDDALAAGREVDRARRERATHRRLADAAREARVDDALLAAGIGPGDPRLHPASHTPAEPEE